MALDLSVLNELSSVAEVQQTTRALRATNRPVVLVPIFGRPHTAHAELIAAAKSLPRAVVFVVVLPGICKRDEELTAAAAQTRVEFSAQEIDYLAQAGATLLWRPTAAEVAVADGRTMVDAGRLATALQSAVSPKAVNRFVTTMVRLLGLTRASDVVIGERSYVQLVVLQQAVSDLAMGVQVHTIGVLRTSSGLPCSRMLGQASPAVTQAAMTISAALVAGTHAATQGIAAAIAATQQVVALAPGLDSVTVTVTDDWLQEVTDTTVGAAEDAYRLHVVATCDGVTLYDQGTVLVGDVRRRQEKEIAQAALAAAGLDAELTEEEFSELQRLRELVARQQTVRKAFGNDASE
ncbi:pantoate--beta-alanine ligase [Corynebacterium choanae]|uniref:Pantothenate synthetase n=1 Tax=Corynebacterium choanae TaxID=1862358 RepID=A0A3G6J4A3_9CORY|nr:pantoate--beta-alanine ligase [Corynebacterium choanae]AZA12732.1 Pantothenate synthetase [Corynebacterium choanae]